MHLCRGHIQSSRKNYEETEYLNLCLYNCLNSRIICPCSLFCPLSDLVNFISGISGAALTYALSPSSSLLYLGDTILNEDMSTIQGLFLEFILTFILTLSVYSAADNGRKYERYHLSIIYGLAMVMCNLVGVSAW